MKKNQNNLQLSKGEQTKARIVSCAAQLFIKNGYYATGIQDILELSGVSKGSFYFYFESKKELGIAVFHYYQNSILKILRKMAEGHTWLEFTEELISWITGNAEKEKNYGCPFAVLGMETAFIDPEISELSYSAMLESTEIFKIPLINTSLSEKEATRKAEWMFSVYEGYMMRYRLSKDVAELKKLGEVMRQL